MTPPSILALTFVAPVMFIGLAAAGIPFLLHLISRVRAKEEPFPTLRFLQRSVEQTARRRRFENWLLLLLRSGVLAVLAMAVTEPVSRAAGHWFGGGKNVAVLLMDNSYSMATGPGGATRLARAKAQAAQLLRGENKPALATLLTTAGPDRPGTLRTQLDAQTREARAVEISYQADAFVDRFAQAREVLETPSDPKRMLYVFTDLQTRSLDSLLNAPALARGKDTSLFIVDCARGEVNNVGITGVKITGLCVVDSLVTFRVTITNSSPGPRLVDVNHRPDNVKSPQQITQRLAGAGQDGATATLTFTRRFDQAGWAMGEFRLAQADDLLVDNVRRYCLKIGPRATALVVSGTGDTDGSGTTLRGEPGAMLSLALDWRDEKEDSLPWPIRVQNLQAEDFTPTSLDGVDAVFFCDVPSFTSQTAQALGTFVRAGGTAWFFLGPSVSTENYNARFGANGVALLPGTLGGAMGQIGPSAPVASLAQVDTNHPFFAGLYNHPQDYLTTLTQRYVRLRNSPATGRMLMTLDGGDPLLVERRLGAGRAEWCMTTASPRWTNLPAQPIFLPMVVRSVLRSRRQVAGSATYTAGQTAAIRPAPRMPAGTRLRVTLPVIGAKTEVRELETDATGVARFADTHRMGVYRWEALSGDEQRLAAGAFAINPFGPESNLTALSPEQLQAELRFRGYKRAYVGANLDALHASVRQQGQGRNWWNLLVAATILLLVAEAFVANHQRRRQNITSTGP